MDYLKIHSFSEIAIHNRWALDFFAPSPFVATKLETQENSVFQSFINAKCDPFASPLKDQSTFYKTGHLILTTPLRVTYLALTVLYVSRVGVFFHTIMVGFSLLKHAWKQTDETLESVKHHGYALIQDIFYTCVGGLCAKFLAEGILNCSYIGGLTPPMGRPPLPTGWTLAISLLFSTTAIVASAALLILAQTPYGASQFHAREEERCGLYFSFILRNRLGVVNEQGGLLPFSCKDQFFTTTNGNLALTPEGNALIEMICYAEMDLIQLVAETNRHLGDSDKIPFTFPFNALDVIAHINRCAPNLPLDRIKGKLLGLGRKIEVLLDLLYNIQELSLNYSWIGSLALSLIKVKTKSVSIERHKTLILQNDYRDYFQHYSGLGNNPPNTAANNNMSLPDIFKEVDLTQEPPSTDLFLKLRYDVCKAINDKNSNLTLEEFGALIGITSQSTFKDVRQIYLNYSRALHPDKHRNHQKNQEQATALFQCLTNFKEQWEKNSEQNRPTS